MCYSQIIISLTIPEFNTYDLYFKDRKLTNKKARIAEVLDTNVDVNTVKVVKKGSSVLLMDSARAVKENLENMGVSGGSFNAQGLLKLAPIAIAIILLYLLFNMDSS